MAMVRISGIAKYQDIGLGFWGIIASSGRHYRPVNMPSELKKEGLSIRCKAIEIHDDESIFMWGKAIKIVSFETMVIS